MADSAPFFSVIIDNYNYARYIADAIDSVLKQTFTDYEMIVVDDASTDHSRDIIQRYGTKLRPVLIERNSGQGHAFNAGFAASRGKWICFLDADDLFFENKLEEIAAAARRHPDAVMICNKGYMVNKALKPMGSLFPRKNLCGNIRRKILRYHESLFPPTSFLVFRRTFLEEVLPLPGYLARIDADFPLQMLAGISGQVIYVNLPLTYYRLHGENWFSNNDFARLDLEASHRLMRRIERWFYCINSHLASLGREERINFTHNRYYRRSLFIFKKIGWMHFLYGALTNPNFMHLFDRIGYLYSSIRRRLEFGIRQS